jgi:bifunctional oligoribonuclease and PAP phosphatase NrnA
MHYSDASPMIESAIASSRNVLAVSHANPDADAVAALIAFKLAFEHAQRSVTMVLGPGTLPETLAFLPETNHVVSVDTVNVSDYDLVIFLDCADEERVGISGPIVLAAAQSASEIINIDHHVTNSRFGTINLVDPDSAASCEILLLLFEDLGVSLTPELATTLMAGIQGDTLGLRTPSTTGRTLEASAMLLRAGADLDTIVDYLFRIRPYSTLKLWAEALNAVAFTGQLIWTEITPDMLDRAGADESEAEGIVNFLAGTQGARAAAMLYRKPDGWRVSLRSITDDVDVSRLAGLFGGGGHARAAGCSVPGDVGARDDFLSTIAAKISTAQPASNPEQ